MTWSFDNSAEMIKDFIKIKIEFKIIQLNKNSGKGAAIKIGVINSKKLDFDADIVFSFISWIREMVKKIL